MRRSSSPSRQSWWWKIGPGSPHTPHQGRTRKSRGTGWHQLRRFCWDEECTLRQFTWAHLKVHSQNCSERTPSVWWSICHWQWIHRNRVQFCNWSSSPGYRAMWDWLFKYSLPLNTVTQDTTDVQRFMKSRVRKTWLSLFRQSLNNSFVDFLNQVKIACTAEQGQSSASMNFPLTV